MKQRVDMRIDIELLDRVDKARGETTRTAFTEAALSAALSSGLKLGPVSTMEPRAESRTSPSQPPNDPTELQRRIRMKIARGKTSKLAEIEAREELGL